MKAGREKRLEGRKSYYIIRETSAELETYGSPSWIRVSRDSEPEESHIVGHMSLGFSRDSGIAM